MSLAKYRKTRNRRRSRSRRAKRTARRRQRQRGGNFSYEIPSSAVVEYRDLDEDGTAPPVLLIKKDYDRRMADQLQERA